MVKLLMWNRRNRIGQQTYITVPWNNVTQDATKEVNTSATVKHIFVNLKDSLSRVFTFLLRLYVDTRIKNWSLMSVPCQLK